MNATRRERHRFETLITRDDIQCRVAELARDLNARYAERELTIVGVMSGCVVFLADLIRLLSMPLRIEFVSASSYRGETTSPGKLALASCDHLDVENRDVLLLDDIFDTGKTLQSILQQIQARRPRSLRTVVLLWKSARNETALRPDAFGFEIPNRFVVGYGLDYDGWYRNRPDIGVLSNPPEPPAVT